MGAAKDVLPSGIYGIYCASDGKWYVGQAKNIHRRNLDEKRELLAGCCHNSHLQNAWNKYGQESFNWVVLTRCPVEDLDQKEIEWIARLDSFTHGFNQTTGGGGCKGYKHTESYKAMMRDLNSHGNSPRKGRPISAESKRRMRENALGGKSPKAKAVQQLSESGVCIMIFDSIGDASRKTEISAAHISEVCRRVSKRKTAGGFIWRWEGDHL